MFYAFYYFLRKVMGYCRHPVHAKLSIMVKGVEVRRCTKCHKFIKQYGNYWF